MLVLMTEMYVKKDITTADAEERIGQVYRIGQNELVNDSSGTLSPQAHKSRKWIIFSIFREKMLDNALPIEMLHLSAFDVGNRDGRDTVSHKVRIKIKEL